MRNICSTMRANSFYMTSFLWEMVVSKLSMAGSIYIQQLNILTNIPKALKCIDSLWQSPSKSSNPSHVVWYIPFCLCLPWMEKKASFFFVFAGPHLVRLTNILKVKEKLRSARNEKICTLRFSLWNHIFTRLKRRVWKCYNIHNGLELYLTVG